jgi:pseudouridine-5'-phosphate glycosidase
MIPDSLSALFFLSHTTVAATMRLAYLAGIDTFVTGGIGGVHRGVESTLDISADLTELARTPVVVVSAGVKSILDIPRTLEVLETYVFVHYKKRKRSIDAFYFSRDLPLTQISTFFVTHHSLFQQRRAGSFVPVR